MKSIWLLPHRFQKIGAIITIPLILVIAYCNIMHIDWQLPIFTTTMGDSTANFTDEIVFTIVIIGSWMVGFSKLEIEDEQTQNLRLNALYWGFIAYHILLLAEYWLFYDLHFLVVISYNAFICMLLYILRFQFLVFKQGKNLPNEE